MLLQNIIPSQQDLSDLKSSRDRPPPSKTAFLSSSNTNHVRKVQNQMNAVRNVSTKGGSMLKKAAFPKENGEDGKTSKQSKLQKHAHSISRDPTMGAIMIRAEKTKDFYKQLHRGQFKFNRLKDIPKFIKGHENWPIYIFNPDTNEIAGPYSITPASYIRATQPNDNGDFEDLPQYGIEINMKNGSLLTHIDRYVPSHLNRKQKQGYDSRPTICKLKEGSHQVQCLQKYIFYDNKSTILTHAGLHQPGYNTSNPKVQCPYPDYNIIHQIKNALQKGDSRSMFKDNSLNMFEDPLYVEYFRYIQVQNRDMKTSLFNQLINACTSLGIPNNIAEIAKAFNQWVFAVETPTNHDDPVIPCFRPIEPPNYLQELILSMIKSVGAMFLFLFLFLLLLLLLGGVV